jgi:hypothetical protein
MELGRAMTDGRLPKLKLTQGGQARRGLAATLGKKYSHPRQISDYSSASESEAGDAGTESPLRHCEK